MSRANWLVASVIRFARAIHQRKLVVWFWIVCILASFVVGPLRAVLTWSPLLFAATLVLFLVPGALLARWCLGSHLSGPGLLPMALPLSAGVFGLAAIPPLALHWNLAAYLWICASLLATTFAFAAWLGVGGERVSREDQDEVNGYRRGGAGLWIPFLLSGLALSFTSVARKIPPGGDVWIYGSWVRGFLNGKALGVYEPFYGQPTRGFSRVDTSGWLLEQAALSRVSGIDPVDLTLNYLAPVLVIAALLGFYAVARVLFQSELAALLTGCLAAASFLVYLGPTPASLGGELVGRITEDKYVARFFFLPASLAASALFLREGGHRHLALFALLCWSAVSVHPIGVVLVGVALAGVLPVHLALERGARGRTLYRAGALGLVLGVVILVPALLVLASGAPLSVARGAFANMTPLESNLIGSMVLAHEKTSKLLVLGDGWYMMHPSLLLNPFVLLACLVGLPLLLSRIKKSLVARLLSGILLFSLVLLYFPPVASLAAAVIGPGQLWRLAWPLDLAATLTVAWMCWRLAAYTFARWGRTRMSLAPFLPLILTGVFVCVIVPLAVPKAVEAYTGNGQERRSCMDPVFRFVVAGISTPGAVVLAQDDESSCVTSWTDAADVVSVRGDSLLKNRQVLERNLGARVEVPRRALDVKTFFDARALDEESMEIILRNEVDYVLLPAGTPLDEQLGHHPAFDRAEGPASKFGFYKVDRRLLQDVGPEAERGVSGG